MDDVVLTFAAVLAGYLIGTFPTADLVTRIATRGKVDIRAVGSGNPGGQNPMKACGTARGVAALRLALPDGVPPAPGGCRGGFWHEVDWGPRMLGYNLMPPLWQDKDGRWAEVWRQHLETNEPWLLEWWEHTERDDYWVERVVPVDRIRAA